MDAIEGGMGTIGNGMTTTVDKAINDVNQKWKKIIKTLDKNLLRKGNHPYFATDKLLSECGGYVKKRRLNMRRKYKIYDYYDDEDDEDFNRNI